MKYLKMLGLAAVAAMALTAFLGAGTASATKLCENNQTSNCTNHVLKGSNLVFSAESSVALTGPFGLVIDTCTTSLVEGPTTTTGGAAETVKGEIKSLTFENCTRPTTTTNTAGQHQFGTLEVHHIAGTDNGTVKSSGATVTIHQVPFSGTCHYLTNNTSIGTLTGKDHPGNATPGTPTFDIAASITSENGCPTGTWEGQYKYTGSTPFNVSAS